MMSPMSYQGIKRTHDNNVISNGGSLRHDKVVSNDGNDQKTFEVLISI